MRCVAVKKQNLEFQKQKIAENITNINKFYREAKRNKTTSKAIANCIDETNGAEEIVVHCGLIFKKQPIEN